MFFLKLVLFPFTLLYFLGVTVRNYLYDSKRLSGFRFSVKTIGVGNLRVGGTGKTPHVEYLITILREKYQIATLSRGYGRKTKGFLLAAPGVHATEIGDEPLQFYARFGPEVAVAVGEERILAIPQILQKKPDVNLILLDDVFQHRAVTPHINILLSEYSRPFYKDIVMPSGRLREPRKGAKRADIVIVSKCPAELSTEEKKKIKSEIHRYTLPGTPVFFTGLRYQKPLPLYKRYEALPGRNAILITGIAHSELMVRKVEQDYLLKKHFSFPDHYLYTPSSIGKIIKHFRETEGNDTFLLLTEKDMVKWKNPAFEKMLSDIPVFYLPVEIYFLEDKHKFDELIFSKLEEKDSNAL